MMSSQQPQQQHYHHHQQRQQRQVNFTPVILLLAASFSWLSFIEGCHCFRSIIGKPTSVRVLPPTITTPSGASLFAFA
jgi:hypothetical protein